MRIGIDYTSAARQSAGIGRFTRELIRAAMALDTGNEYRLLVAGRQPIAEAHLPRTGRGFRLVQTPLSERNLVRLWHRLQIPLPVEVFLGRLDIFHSPDFVLPPVARAVKVLTIHDLSFLRVPECADPRLRWYLGQVVPRSVRRADFLLADSESTRRDLIELLGVPPDRVQVIYGGVDARFAPVEDAEALRRVRETYAGGRPFILAVGTLEPRKNYPTLIRAFAQARQAARLPHALIIVGRKGWVYEPIFAAVDELGLHDHVLFPGFVPDEELPVLYSAADVLVTPSFYEGFGLPALEAMACGTPVIVSDVSSLPEVVGDAGVRIDPRDEAGLAEAMVHVVQDSALRAALRAAGRERARRFTWDDAARELLAVYARVGGG
ncbi:MAG: glycosyltransferase family 1 protein [Anaerolineales bacterium]